MTAAGARLRRHVHGTTAVTIDLDHGGRFTELRLAGRDWLWRRPAPERAGVRPGDPFVDAGGLEECVPTVRGAPDHGDVWSRPWTAVTQAQARVETDELALTRDLRVLDGRVVFDYELRAAPGFAFVWAAHGLLDLSDRAVIELPVGNPIRVFPERAELPEGAVPTEQAYVEAAWPRWGRTDLSRVGPVDGTAVGLVATDCPVVAVRDADSTIVFELTAADASLPTSVAIWRNLGGFPAENPYRSIGVEPMLGRVFDRAEARRPRDAVVVPRSGTVAWRLTVTGT